MNFRGTPSLSSARPRRRSGAPGRRGQRATENDTTHFYYLLPADKVELCDPHRRRPDEHSAAAQSDWASRRGRCWARSRATTASPSSNSTSRSGARHSPLAVRPHGAGEQADVEPRPPPICAPYYSEWYHPNNATLVVTGDVKAADIFRWAEQYFGKIPSRPLPAFDRAAASAARTAKCDRERHRRLPVCRRRHQLPDRGRSRSGASRDQRAGLAHRQRALAVLQSAGRERIGPRLLGRRRHHAPLRAHARLLHYRSGEDAGRGAHRVGRHARIAARLRGPHRPGARRQAAGRRGTRPTRAIRSRVSGIATAPRSVSPGAIPRASTPRRRRSPRPTSTRCSPKRS